MKKKICSKCRIEKDVSEYHSRSLSKDGLNCWCKSCHSEYKKKWKKENIEEIKETDRKYRLKNYKKIKEYQLKNKERTKEYRKTNKQHIKEYNDKWRYNNKQYNLINKEAKKRYNKKYNSSHSDLCNILTQRRNAKKKLLPSTFTLNQWNECKEYFDNKCAYCGKEVFLTQDHFISVNDGGSYSKDNIIPACQSCNNRKSDKKFDKWYPGYIYYSKEREENIYKYLNSLNNF